ncbi:hypothetical protein OQA88_3228 [Cercophora sp. LCS_1]
MSKYPYKPLSPREIRLIEYDQPRPDNIIQLKLHHASLNPPPEYRALSYTWSTPIDELPPDWADDNKTKVVLLDGIEFPVRYNLDAALRRFQPNPTDASLLLWVDAICINQTDTSERDTQVAMMGQIYSKSLATLVWLGPEVNDSDLSLRAIREINETWMKRPARLRERPIPSSSDPEDILQLYRHHVQMETAALEGYAADTFSRVDGLVHLLGRPWWRRAWVVQEVLLSQKTLVFCGSSEPLEWNEFVTAAGVLSGIQDSYFVLGHEDLNSMVEWMMHLRMGSLFSGEVKIPYTPRFESHTSSLREMLRLLRYKQATDPRDKVYAGLGLITDSGDVVVDYSSTSVGGLYIQVTKLCIAKEGNLRVLSGCHSKPGYDLPSWVPDYSDHRRELAHSNISEDSGISYAAGGDAVLDFEFQGNRLLLRGVCVSTVSYIGPIEDRLRYPRGQNVVKHAMEDKWLSKWLISHVTRIPPRIPPLLVCPKAEGEEWAYRLTKEEMWLAYLKTLSAGRPPPEEELADPEFRRLVSRVFQHRSFITFENGVIGLGPRYPELGDELCFVVGAETPLLLRPCGDGRYNLVGECYAHGLMHGEVWNLMVKPDGQKLRAEEIPRVEII